MRQPKLPQSSPLPLTEGQAICALILSGIALVSADLDSLQRAVVVGVAVVRTGLHSAGDALVGMLVHDHFLL